MRVGAGVCASVSKHPVLLLPLVFSFFLPQQESARVQLVVKVSIQPRLSRHTVFEGNTLDLLHPSVVFVSRGHSHLLLLQWVE